MGTKLSAKTAILASATDDSDIVMIVDVSSGTSHKMTKAEARKMFFDQILASQAEAEAGTATDKTMNPLRVAQAIAALGSQTPPTMQTFGSSGTWTKPAGCTTIKVTVIGGGGGGSDDSLGGFGGGGRICYVDVSSISSATITVGAGGAGSTSSSNSAGTNSQYSDGTNTVTGNGAASTATAAATGSDSGADILASLNIRGGRTDTGMGADSMFGSGGNTHGATGAAGLGYGAGGAAGSTTGGAGATGVVFIEEYYG